jgi:propionate CoA-transferase
LSAVDEITFCGPEAVRAGRKVFYVTPVGVFRLTERGIELQSVMPGIDIQRDILDFATARILLPEDARVPEVEASVVTGKGFRLRMA